MKTCVYYATYECNDTCEFCGMWQRSEKGAEAPVEVIREKLKELKRREVNKLVVTGGEPLLNDALPEILRIAKGFNFEIDLYTNGILYAERSAAIEKLTDKLFFSLDYPILSEHDRSRGVDCFDLVVEGIEIARDKKENAVISFTITRDSIRFLPEMVELSEKLKVPLHINPVYDFFGTQGFDKRSIQSIKYYSKRKNVFSDLAMLAFVENGGNKAILPRCRAGETTITLLPDGRITRPCYFNQDGKQGKEDICSSCMRSEYMLPSFSVGLDKYFWLNLYSEWVNKRKKEEVK
ncbi:MAG: radical SAM protein [Candidatus Margulisiibacteriota bacterium]